MKNNLCTEYKEVVVKSIGKIPDLNTFAKFLPKIKEKASEIENNLEKFNSLFLNEDFLSENDLLSLQKFAQLTKNKNCVPNSKENAFKLLSEISQKDLDETANILKEKSNKLDQIKEISDSYCYLEKNFNEKITEIDNFKEIVLNFNKIYNFIQNLQESKLFSFLQSKLESYKNPLQISWEKIMKNCFVFEKNEIFFDFENYEKTKNLLFSNIFNIENLNIEIFEMLHTKIFKIEVSTDNTFSKYFTVKINENNRKFTILLHENHKKINPEEPYCFIEEIFKVFVESLESFIYLSNLFNVVSSSFISKTLSIFKSCLEKLHEGIESEASQKKFAEILENCEKSIPNNKYFHFSEEFSHLPYLIFSQENKEDLLQLRSDFHKRMRLLLTEEVEDKKALFYEINDILTNKIKFLEKKFDFFEKYKGTSVCHNFFWSCFANYKVIVVLFLSLDSDLEEYEKKQGYYNYLLSWLTIIDTAIIKLFDSYKISVENVDEKAREEFLILMRTILLVENICWKHMPK